MIQKKKLKKMAAFTIFLAILLPVVTASASSFQYLTRDEILDTMGTEPVTETESVPETIQETESSSTQVRYINSQNTSVQQHTESVIETEQPAEETQPVVSDLVLQVSEKLASLTTEQKVAQMFFVYPESLNITTTADEGTVSAFEACPVGGVCYFEQNITSAEQITEVNRRLNEISLQTIGLPVFLSTDEEGGTVRRISGRIIDTEIKDMQSITSSEEAYNTCVTIATYLKDLGFNCDFAPDADIWSNPSNTVIGSRSFGTDAMTVSERVSYAVVGFETTGIRSTLKHFPGHGDTTEDSHNEAAVCNKSMTEMEQMELLPFQNGINNGCSFVMVGHITCPNISGSLPATLSSFWVTDTLKNRMGFKGVTITDAMNMGAITGSYSSGEAVISAVNAGIDMILCPVDFMSDYQSLLNAVQNGTVSMERINDAVTRILTLKLGMIQ